MRRFQSFRLDSANQCLWQGEARVEIAPKAFDVLRYLVEHAGRLVTQDELLEALWPGTYVNPEVLRTYVLKIRRALGDRPDKPAFIQTYPKRGYQFVAPVIDENAPETLPAEETKRIVGRELALAELGAYLRRALQNERQVVFITGEAGIGKTALADEFQRRAQVNAPGVRIVRGECIESHDGKEAYYPILESLGQLCHGPAGDSVIQILAAVAPTLLIQFPAFVKREQREMLQQEIGGATHERMQREICEAMETIASESPLLLVLEDLQWADPSTVDLISALARRRQPAKLMLIGMYRPVDVVLSDHPLKALKQDLLLHHLCHEIALQPLGEADVAEYLAAESEGAAVPEGLAALVHRHTEGNPLFMVEVLEHMREKKLITKENGALRFTLPLREIQLQAPESLRQMIEAWIERLSDEERRALEAASVTGVLFPAAVSAAAADMDVEKFENLCEGLSRRAQKVRSADPQEFPDGTVSSRYEFVHDLYRDVLYRSQSLAKRKKIHLHVGELLAALYAPRLGEVATELAYHFEQGGDWPRTVKYLRLAADTAVRRYAPQEAAALLEKALSWVSKLPQSQRAASEIEILETLASIPLFSNNPWTVETYDALVARAAYHGLVDVEVRALLDKAWVLACTNAQSGLEVLDRALALTARQVDPLAQARSRMRGSSIRIWANGWNDEDATVCRKAMSEIRRAGDPLVLGPCLIDYGYLLLFCSEYRESQRSVLEGLAALTSESKENRGASLFDQGLGTWVLYLDLLCLGTWGEALREMESAIAVQIKNANDWLAQVWRVWQAWLHIHAMDFAGALEICQSAARLGGQAWVPMAQRYYLAVTGTAEVALGNHERALEHLSLAIQEVDRSRVNHDWYHRLLVESALIELWLDKGDFVQARSHGDRLLQLTLATVERTWHALAWEANARVAMAETDFARAQDCIAKALLAMEGYETPLAAWRVHATAAALHERTGNIELAAHHRELSRETIMKLANSLPAEEPLRQKFLSAPMVRNILGDADRVRAQEA